MAPSPVQITAIGAVLVAAVYQLFLKDLLFVSLGVGRTMQPLSAFPYSCRRIHHARLEACEDMWIDDEARVLYAACTSAAGRREWNPSMSKLNVSGRRPGGDYVFVLDIDDPGADGLFGVRQLKPRGYVGATGDGSLDLHGFDVEVVDGGSRLRFWMINHRPPVDGEGQFLDAGKLGANSTVEVFDVERGGEEMVHVRTIASAVVATPNKLAATGDGGFVVTNDHSHKVGLRRQLDSFIGGGSLAYCGPTADTCHVGASSGFNYPNGIVKGVDGLYYVPSSFVDQIRVMQLHSSNQTLTEVDTIHLGMPVDNLSVDLRSGDLYAAAFPDVLKLLKSFKDPYHVDSPTTVWRIRKRSAGKAGEGEESTYEVKKVLEDREAKVVGGATIARHDSKTGRLFIGGAIAPYITVCEPR